MSESGQTNLHEVYTSVPDHRVVTQQHVVPDYRTVTTQHVVPDHKIVTQEQTITTQTRVPTAHDHVGTQVVTHNPGHAHTTSGGAPTTQTVDVSRNGYVGLAPTTHYNAYTGNCGGAANCASNGYQCCGGIGFLGRNMCWGSCNQVAGATCGAHNLCAAGTSCCNGVCTAGVAGASCVSPYNMLHGDLNNLHTSLRSEVTTLNALGANSPNLVAQTNVVNGLQNRILGYRGTLAERDYVYNGFFGDMRVNNANLYNQYRIGGLGTNIMGLYGNRRAYAYNGFFNNLEYANPNVYRNGYFGVYRNTAPRVYNRYHTLLSSLGEEYESDLALPVPAIIGIVIGALLLLVIFCFGLRTYRKRQSGLQPVFQQSQLQFPMPSPAKSGSMGGNQMVALPVNQTDMTVQDIYDPNTSGQVVDDQKQPQQKQRDPKVAQLVRQNTGTSNGTAQNANTFYT